MVGIKAHVVDVLTEFGEERVRNLCKAAISIRIREGPLWPICSLLPLAGMCANACVFLRKNIV